MRKSLQLCSNRYYTRRNMSSFSRKLVGFDAPTVWGEFTPLAIANKSVNLGQGFPDYPTPDFVKKALCDAIHQDYNQYCRSAGEPSLVQALAKHYSPLVGREIDALNEITIGVGATETLFAVMQAHLNEGDEVVVLEPTFDIYPAQVQMAGGVCKYVPLSLNLEKGIWELDMSKLEAAISPKTKILLLNTPHNPSGKVLTRDELESVANILQSHPHVIAVMDEVYEKLIYDNKEHVRLASLPGMWERTITVSSSGKTFSATGWKIGWCYGHKDLIKPVIMANQWVQFSVSTPTQRAIAMILEEAEKPYEGYSSYYEYVKHDFERKRNKLVQTLEEASFKPIIPDAGYFVVADTGAHTVPEHHFLQPGLNGEVPVSRDWAFARWLTVDVGVTPIPPSAFYVPETKALAQNMARFAFCKTDASLDEAHNRLQQLVKKE